MLVLSRRTNETLVLNDDIRFTVLGICGNQVRIGIEAPKDVIIRREEIIGRPELTQDDDHANAANYCKPRRGMRRLRPD